LRPLAYPVGAVEEHGVKPSGELKLVTEVAGASPERDARLVPRTRNDCPLAFGAVNGEEVQRLVVSVGQSERQHDVAEADVGPVGERLLNPELLQLYLAALLGLGFPFAAFLGLLLDGSAAAAVFKLYFHANAPALAEVVAEVNHGVGDVETAVRRVVLIVSRIGVAERIVAVKVARIRQFAVSAHTEAVALGVLVNAVCSRCLRLGRARSQAERNRAE
jgi:hypothetical protein